MHGESHQLAARDTLVLGCGPFTGQAEALDPAAGRAQRDVLYYAELAEELGLLIADIAVGERLGGDIALDGSMTLRAYRVRLIRGEPRPHDHQALRWVTAAEIHDVDWVPADRGFLADLTRAL